MVSQLNWLFQIFSHQTVEKLLHLIHIERQEIFYRLQNLHEMSKGHRKYVEWRRDLLLKTQFRPDLRTTDEELH